MKPSSVAVIAAVTALCAGILGLFTDIGLSFVRWVNCGPFSTLNEEQSEVCKRQL